MIKDDKERVIGKLVAINSEKFIVELLNQSINFTINGFDDIYHYAQINGLVILPYQDYYIVAEIFGVREKDSSEKWSGEKEQVLNKANSVKYIDITPIGTIQNGSFKYGVSVFPTLYSDVLYIKKNELDIVFETIEQLNNIEINGLSGKQWKTLEIGTSTVFPDYKIKVDINGFFGSHSAILGNTGSGKSCTISTIFQSLFEYKTFSAIGSSIILFDVNGEYHKAFSQLENEDISVVYYSVNTTESKNSFEEKYGFNICDNIEYRELSLPHWFLNIDEWALMLQASEKAQLPILRSAINLLKMFSGNPVNHVKVKNHILCLAILHILRDESSPAASSTRIKAILGKFNTNDINLEVVVNSNMTLRQALHVNFGDMPQIQSILDYLETEDDEGNKMYQLENFDIPDSINIEFVSNFDEVESALDLAILFEEAHGNNQIRDYCSSMLTRYKSLKERGEFRFMTDISESINSCEFLDEILGLKDEKKSSQVTIFDLNSMEDDVVEVISCVISRLIFERLRILERRSSFPVNLILEEAHRYISEQKSSNFTKANQIFSRIAKEGRKYGLFLLVSSQRPSELSKTVLSQCSNFIVHKIQHPDDLYQIRQMTPHISSNTLSRLPSIPRQHALIFGHSVQIPSLFKVNTASPTPYSTDSDIVSNWFIPNE